MGKTMATTEGRSVTGAIKELTTIHNKLKTTTTKNRGDNKLTEARKHDTDRNGSGQMCTCRTPKNTNNVYSTD